MQTKDRISLIGAAGIGLFALSACSADEMPSGQLSSILEDHTDALDASCDEDLVLSDGEQVSCDFSRPAAESEDPMRITFSEDGHALLADHPDTYIRTTIDLDEEDSSAVANESDDESKEYFRDAIPAAELEEIADRHYIRATHTGLREEGDPPPEPASINCESDLETSATSPGDGPTCTVNDVTYEALMGSDTEIHFDRTDLDEGFVYDLLARDIASVDSDVEIDDTGSDGIEG